MTGRPRVYPTCPTHQLQMYELAREAQHLVRVITEWRIIAGRTTKHHTTTPELRLNKVPHQDAPPRPRKARTS